ncbi:MAG: hypothetical protein ACIAS6_01965 [Phycisphaerales bacterium JB060]
MNSIGTRALGVLAGCGLMAATPFLAAAWGQGVPQPPDYGVWCTEHPGGMQGHICKVCSNCELDESEDPPVYVCGNLVAEQVCAEGERAVCSLQGPPSYYTATCELYPSN